jgi:voltage-gated potassium channel Kch
MAAGPAGASGRIVRWLTFWRMMDIRLVVASIAMTALILGYIGLALYIPHQPASAGYGDSWDDILFYDLQLYTLSSAPAGGRGPFPVWLGIARFLAPVVTVLAFVVALRPALIDQLRRYRAAYGHGHSIVAGDGAVALTLARNLARGGDKKVIIVSASDDTLAEASRYDLLTVRGDLYDDDTLTAAGVAKAEEFFACTGHGRLNMTIAMLAGRLTPRRKQPLCAYALIPSAELIRGTELVLDVRGQLLDAYAADIYLDFFTLEDSAASVLLDRYPPDWSENSGHVEVIGSGALGQAILRETTKRYGSLAVIVGRSTTHGQERSLPESGKYTVYVCPDDNDDALREGTEVARRGDGDRGQVVICMREPISLATLAGTGSLRDSGARVRIFEVIEAACTPGPIRGQSFIQQLARSIHGAYVDRARDRGETPMENPSMVAWSRLSTDLREANLAQAASIGVKLEAINAIVIPAAATAPEFRFTDREIESLAQLEHERWMRERLARGWTYGERRDNRRQVLPDLTDWTALPEDQREKERDFIRAIPGVLRQVGYQILRLPGLPPSLSWPR